MRRRLLLGSAGISEPIPVEDSLACDVVFYNQDLDELIIRRSKKDWQKDEKPVGIVVIPASHNVYGNGTCGVVSIVAMNCDTPKTGGNESPMHWGVYGTDISTITNYNKVVVVENSSSNAASGLSSSDYAYIPRLYYVGGTPVRSTLPYAPSPYSGSDYKSGGYNESYGTTKFDTSTDKNVLADFDGRGNTDKILVQRGSKDYDSWKPTYNNKSDYPAASCCDMFSTAGTKQGDWYLPAAGELGYIIPRIYDINDTISKLRTVYGVGVSLDTNTIYWSSSEYNLRYAYYGYTGTGLVSASDKDVGRRVYAYMQLKPQPKFIDMGTSVLWADRNIGATKPEENGWYFHWAGTTPYNVDRTPVGGGVAINFNYNSNCPYWVRGSADSSKYSKYTATDKYSSTGIADNKLILEPEDDAAHVHLGDDCRMPTIEEFNELLNACNTKWMTNYNSTGVKGCLFTLKADPSKTLFFPSNGTLTGASGINTDSGHCWSSSLDSSDSYRSKLLSVSFSAVLLSTGGRFNGSGIRPVKPKKN